MIFLTERFFIYLNILFKNYNKKNTLYKLDYIKKLFKISKNKIKLIYQFYFF